MRTTAVRVGEEATDRCLDGGSEEVALYGGCTFGRRGGDDVDAYDTAVGCGAIDCDLFYVFTHTMC